MILPNLFNNRVDKDMIIDYSITPKFTKITIKRYWHIYNEIYDTDEYLLKNDKLW
jgi:hypothetical protein